MTFGFQIPNRGPLATPENLRTLATRAEEMSFDHLWVIDRVAIPTQSSSPYPYGPPGSSPLQPDQPYCEALSTLTYLAGFTQRIKLGTSVLLIPLRDPVLTAKIIATLDYLSGGRVILGAGVGWLEEEFEALGLNIFAERGKVTDEYIRIFKELWTKEEPQYQGQYYQVSGIKFHPKPVQKPHPPIWIGGHSPAALRRAASIGDGWMPAGLIGPVSLEPAEMAEQIDQLRNWTEKLGRPREAVEVAFSTFVSFDSPGAGPRRTLSGSPQEMAADIVRYQQVGVKHFVFAFLGNEMEPLLENMEQFAKEVRPLVR